MARSRLFAHRALRGNSKLEPAARDIDHVSVLDIFWFDRFAMNGRPKVNGLGTLFSINYASQMNITRASIITHSAGTHDRLVHSGRTIECDRTGSIRKSRRSEEH